MLSFFSRIEKWILFSIYLGNTSLKNKCPKENILFFKEVFPYFDNEKWNKNASKSISRMKSEMKTLRDRDQEVKSRVSHITPFLNWA